MPELPEVENVVRGLDAEITGQCVAQVLVLRADVVHGNATAMQALLGGRRVRRVTRQGKRIHIACESETELVVHLGMSGQLTLAEQEQPIEAHTHLRLIFDDLPREVRFRDPRRFGGVWFFGTTSAESARSLGQLGIDPLTAPLEDFRKVLSRRRQIKALLLDQRVVAGLGNIYCDEILHRAGIHPLTPAATLNEDQVRRLRRTMRAVLNAAIRAGGSSINDYVDAAGRKGGYQNRHRVYGREGQPCPTCRTPITKALIAGRGTHFCSRCQPPL